MKRPRPKQVEYMVQQMPTPPGKWFIMTPKTEHMEAASASP